MSSVIVIDPTKECKPCRKPAFPNREGQFVPDVTFRLRRNGEWATVTTDDLFAGRNVVVFSLPGAFTPTCSSTHLPRFNELAPRLPRAGHRRDRLHLGQRSVRDGGVGQGPGSGERLPAARRQRRIHRRRWACSSTSRTSTSASARGATRCWCATGRSRRSSSSRRSRATRSRSPTRTRCSTTSTRVRRTPDQVAILTREGCAFCAKAKRQLADAGYKYVEVPLPHSIRTKALGAIAGARHRAAGLHQRPADRRLGGPGSVSAQGGVSEPPPATIVRVRAPPPAAAPSNARSQHAEFHRHANATNFTPTSPSSARERPGWPPTAPRRQRASTRC